jgi:ATP-binding cassette subfamily C protein
MRLLAIFVRAYPWESAIMLFALLLAGIAEGASLSALLPLLSVAIKQETGDEAATAESAAEPDSFEQLVTTTLVSLGITPSIGVLLAVIMIGITTKSALVLFAKKRVGYTAAQVTTDLRLSLLRALLSTRWEYFLHQPVGQLANSMATEAIRASEAYVYGTTLLAIFIQSIVYTGVAVLVSWQATLACLGAGVLILLVSHFLVEMSRRAGKRQTKLMISLLARLTDTLQSVKPLKAMARENLADSVLTAETEKLNRALRKEVFSRSFLDAGQEPMFAGVIALGVYLALVQFEMPLATVMVLVMVLARVLAQLGKIQKQYQKMVTSESAFWSLQGTVDKAVAAVEDSGGTSVPTLSDSITLRNISFAYGDKKILDELDMEIPFGTLTTVVGRSGGGKTTVMDMITGLLRPQSGQVSVDGVPMQQIELRGWRRMIGYVPQENVLLHDSVYTNITLGDAELDESDAEYALRAAGAWEFVTALPQGLHSTVGERGGKLSGGQRQRVMIARALAHRPKLLILDEATSALDPQSEAAICETLRQLRGDLTILAISHEPALVNAADRVYRLESGRAATTDSAGAFAVAGSG